jgi:uncharacterized protein YwqG
MIHKTHLILPPELELFRDSIESSLKPLLAIETMPSQKTTFWQSKFRGLPYFPKNFSYPISNEGEYLYLLAQINFAECPPLNNFPSEGILQFYIADDDLWGADFDHPDSQNGFRVLYFPEPPLDESQIITDFTFLPVNNNLPIQGELILNFIPQIAPISVSDYGFSQIFHPYFSDDGEKYDQFCDLYDQSFPSIGHHLGGYSYFTQNDPREHFYIINDEPYVLLFQMDSDGESILWGDYGVCNFFIKELDLQKLDFSRVIYNWDCS